MRGYSMFLQFALVQVLSVSGLRIPFRTEDSLKNVHSRATNVVFADAGDPYNFNVVDLTGDNQIIYVGNITLDGNSYEVQLDTGSSDLFIDTQGIPFSNVNVTSINATLVYGDTSAAVGQIARAPVQFGNFSVPSQAFVNTPGTNATSDNDRGLLGLGPFTISVIYNNLVNTTYNGLPLLNNIFNLNPSVPNIITFLLSRSNLGITDGGIFTIGEVDPNWSAVVNQSKVAIAQDFGQWIGLMDGIIVNGKNYSGHGLLSSKEPNPTIVNPAFKGDAVKDKLLSVFDTGTATAFVPQHYFDIIYKDVKGKKAIDKSLALYSMPCDTKLNVSMVFNGTEYPINPLDLTRLANIGNETFCVNAFASGNETGQGIDFVLGDAFLKNVYILYNYGNWTEQSDNLPYVQLLSTTNQSEAWAQFDDLNNARMTQWKGLNGTFTL